MSSAFGEFSSRTPVIQLPVSTLGEQCADPKGPSHLVPNDYSAERR